VSVGQRLFLRIRARMTQAITEFPVSAFEEESRNH
jgi:hypothetical protein